MAWKDEHRRAADRRGLRYPTNLTDAKWALVSPPIRPARQGGRPRTVNVQEVQNAVFYLLSTGCQWSALPKDLPPKSTVHGYLAQWDWDGTIERIRHVLYVETREAAGRARARLPLHAGLLRRVDLCEAWAPLLFHEHDAAGAEAERISPVQAAAVSPATQRKRATRHTEAGLPVVDYAGLMQHLATLTLNFVAVPNAPDAAFTMLAKPTPLQDAALQRLGAILPVSSSTSDWRRKNPAKTWAETQPAVKTSA